MVLSLLAVLAACKKAEIPAEHQPFAAGTGTRPEPAKAAPVAGFDVASLPVSGAALGDFPYVGLPQGYVFRGTPTALDFDRVPFWTGDRLEPVEGHVWQAVVTAEKGKAFSPLEVQRNLEAEIAAMGGRKIFDGHMPAASFDRLKQMPGDVPLKYVDGLGDIYNEATQTFVVHRADRDIWMHLCASGFSAGLIVTETRALQVTAALLSASELKARIDRAGKVALHVNFATDSAMILPDAQAQIGQVVQLLRDDPALALVVDGYTDDTGNAARNEALSEGRAGSVVDALVAQGIAASRLVAAGHGAADPVADNATAQGKAENRRVELVKR